MDMQAMMQMFQSQRSADKVLVEFRAGLCTTSGSTVTPDKRKGKFKLVQTASGDLKVEWRLRPSDNKEVDLMVQPNAATFEKVPECKTGRVFLLRFPGSNTLRFFWMQEPTDEKDEEWEKKINDHIKNPPPRAAAGMGGVGGHGGMGALSEEAMLARAIAESARAAQASASAGGASGGSSSSGAAGGLAALARQLQEGNTDELMDVLQPDLVLEAVGSDEKFFDELKDTLPEGQRSLEDIKQQLRSPQLRQAVNRLSSVLNSPQYGAVVASMGLQQFTGGDMGVTAFLEAIRRQAVDEGASAADGSGQGSVSEVDLELMQLEGVDDEEDEDVDMDEPPE